MKKYYLTISTGLLAALFLYAFYRTCNTVVNRAFAAVLSQSRFDALREAVTTALPLPKFVIYSMPEALWVFCATLMSKNLFFGVSRRPVNCMYLPLAFAYLWEFFQLTGVTNGRFDFFDLFSCLAASIMAQEFLRPPYAPVHVLRHFSWQGVMFFTGFGIVYLSHVVV